MPWSLMRLVIAVIGVTILALLSGVGEDNDKKAELTLPLGTSVARCPAFDGEGSPDWRKRSLVAGPVGVRKLPPPLGAMDRESSGTLTARMPILVEGSKPVRITVPESLKGTFLSYGRPREQPAGSGIYLSDFGSIIFVPCEDQPRTIFPGRISVQKAGTDVRLRVRVRDGDSRINFLNIGRPKPRKADPPV